jgi:single-stranded-DNA-specific exonuclease
MFPGTASTVDLGLDGTYRDFNKENIDFYFVPMINAANRVLGNVNSLIYDIMTLFSHDYAGYPHVYRDLNKERKFMRTEMLRLHKKNDSTQAIVEALYPNPSDGNFMGISGLVASDIVESEGKPTLIGIEHENGIVHFSGRSVPGFDLYSALDEIKKSHPEIDFKFGGHAEALGMSCNKNVIPTMQTLLSEEFTKSGKHEEAEIYYDLGGSLQNVKELFMRYYPFGSGFEFPRFYIEGLVGFCNFSKRTFTMPDISRNEEITVFSKADYDKVVTIATKKRSELIKMEFSLSCDDRGEIYLKADKFF